MYIENSQKITNSVNLPGSDHTVMQSIRHVKYISFTKTHLAFIRLIVIKMSSAMNTNHY